MITVHAMDATDALHAAGSAPGAVRDVLAAVLLLSGAAFCLLGAIGLLRFPDTLSWLHAAAKAQTLGLLLILLGTAAQVPLPYTLMLALVALFQVITVPVTGQLVGRTAYRTSGAAPSGLLTDELGDRLARDGEASPPPPGPGTSPDPDADR